MERNWKTNWTITYVCKSFYENQQNYGKNQPNKKKSKLSSREKSLIIRKASNKMISEANIVEECELNVTPQTVRNVLRNYGLFKFEKMKKNLF